MVPLATVFIMTDERLITSMSTLMKSEVTLRSEGTVAGCIITRVFPTMGGLLGVLVMQDRETEDHSLQLGMHELVVAQIILR